MNAKHSRRPRSDEAQFRAAEAFLRAHDPGKAFPGGFSPEREKRVLRYMRHPLLATIFLHHRTAALACAGLLILLVVVLLSLVFRVRPKEVLAVELLPPPPEAPYVELDPPDPQPDPADQALPLPPPEFDEAPVEEPPLPDEGPDGGDGPDAPPAGAFEGTETQPEEAP